MLETFNISLESLNIFGIFPMLIAIVGALVILIVDMGLKRPNKQLYTMLTILFLILDLGYLLLFNISDVQRAFFDLILIDGISILGQLIILTAAILFIPLTLSYQRFHEFQYPEYYALFLLMCSGFQFMVSSDHLIVIFLGLETASLALYALIAMHNRATAFEAAIKYFTMGALSAGCFAFASMLLYAATGHLELEGVKNILSMKPQESLLVPCAFVFFVASLGFKASLVPFHTWTPDVYEGSNSFLAGFMSIVPKIAAFVVAIRILGFFIEGSVFAHNIVYLLIILTITLPNLVALVQEDVKRMLAYSSISHAGFAFSAILIGEVQSVALFAYWFLFLFTNLGVFAMLWITRTKEQLWDKRYDHTYTKFSGLIKLCPMAAVIMGLFMFSLAGIPPFSVFWGKVYLMSVAMNNGYLFLVVVMAVNSAIAAYYYLKLVVYMFLKEPLVSDGSIYLRNVTLPLKIVIGIATVYVCLSTFFVDGLLTNVTALITASFEF